MSYIGKQPDVVAVPSNGSITNAQVAVNAAIEATKLSFTQSGTGAVARTVESKLREVVSVKDFGAVGDGVTDDSAALTAAVTNANALASVGSPQARAVYVYFPPGRYVINSAPPAFQTGRCISVVGAGTGLTILQIGTSLSGDIFQWSESWIPTVANISVNVKGITFVGSRSASNNQNALMFYDRCDLVHVDDVSFFDLKGTCLSVGKRKNQVISYNRESRYSNIRAFSCGAAGSPVIQVTTEAAPGVTSGDATNELAYSHVDIYNPVGAPGLDIQYRGVPGGGMRQLSFVDLRIEGKEDDTSGCDLLVIGSQQSVGNIFNLHFGDAALITTQTGFSGLRVTAPAPYWVWNLNFQGVIDGGNPKGKGLVLDGCRDSFFDLGILYSPNDTAVTVTSYANKLLFADYGGRLGWTYNIASAVRNQIDFLSRVNIDGALNFRFAPAALPTSPVAGDVYYDASVNKLRCYNGSTWNDLF